MSSARALSVLIIYAGLSFFPPYASTQPDSAVTVASLLSKAGCPLSGDQKKTLDSIKMGLGFGDIYEILYKTFNDNQKAALIDAFGPWQGYGEWQTTPRYLHWVVVFENYGQPLTQSQVQKLKNLPRDPMPETDTKAQEEWKNRNIPMEQILNKEQMALLEEMYHKRGPN